MRKFILLTFIMILSFVYAQTVTVVTTGVGATESQARSEALRMAVEQGAGVRIFSSTEVKDFVALKDVLISESFGWVTSYKVLSSIRKSMNEYEVKVEAIVTKDISSSWAKLKILIQENGNPKIMFCIRETLDGQEIIPSTGEGKLRDKFRDLGFVVQDRQMAEELKNMQKEVAKMENDLQSLTALVSKRDTDLLVIGDLKGSLSKVQNVYGMQFFFHAYNFNVRIINVDNAMIDGSLSENYITKKDGSLYSSETAGRAGFLDIVNEKYTQALMASLIKSWVKNVQEGCEMTVVISNLKFSQRKPIIESLTAWSDVITSVQVEHFRSGRLQLRIKSKLKAEEVVEKFEEASLPLEVVEFQRNTLELKYTTN